MSDDAIVVTFRAWVPVYRWRLRWTAKVGLEVVLEYWEHDDGRSCFVTFGDEVRGDAK